MLEELFYKVLASMEYLIVESTELFFFAWLECALLAFFII